MTIVDTAAIFAESARRAFAAAYPDRPAKLSHGLVGHSLLTLDALAALAERMPAAGPWARSRADRFVHWSSP